MNAEKPKTEQNENQTTEWDSLKEVTFDYRGLDQKDKDDLDNVKDWLEHGRIDAKKAAHYRDEIMNRHKITNEDQPITATPEIPEANDQIEELQWDSRLTQEQIDDLIEKGIYEPTGPEYQQALMEFGLKPEAAEKVEELQWDSRLTQEQIDDLIEKGIYEPTGPEYQQALMEFGLEKPKVKEPTPQEDSEHEKELDKAREAELDNAREAELDKAREAELAAERDALIAKKAELEAEIEYKKKLLEQGPLVAINADFTHDKEELAHDLAETALNEELAKANLFKRLWRGTLFKKFYETKYTNEFMRGERTANINGEELTAEEIISRDSKDSAISRFIKGATEDMRFIHEKIGKERKDGTYDGEKLTDADQETTEKVKSAIEKFASAKIPEGGSLEDLKREFTNEMARLKAEARDDNKNVDTLLMDNYLEVAIQARERAEHGIAMERVMEGFKVYNADVRNGIRTEAHRDNIDKITNYLEKHTGGLVPPQIIAGAVSIASALTQTGARAIAGATGGILVSGAISGLKERNRITEDRARMLRDAAVGLEHGDTSGEEEEPKSRRAKRIAKYEARIGNTLYDLQKAIDLTDNIKSAMNMEGEGKNDAILRAIAEARVRIDMSDSEQKDLIAYSSTDKRGDERLKLDEAVIEAERALSSQDAEKLTVMKEQIAKEISNGIDEKDNDFRRQRAIMATQKAGKTLALGVATFFGSQEIMAALDPNKIGLFEKLGLIKTQNEQDASETILAGLAGPRVRTDTYINKVDDISGDNQNAIKAYEDAGYTKTKTTEAWTETKPEITNVDPADSTAKVDVIYDGWANNGTKVADGNELNLYLRDGQFVSGMKGNSTMGDRVIDYASEAAAGKIKGYVTIGDAKFEIARDINDAGQFIWGENGVVTTTTGETIRVVGADGEKLYKYFEIALDNGTDANGIDHIIPLATDVGRDTFSGKVQQIVEKVIEHPATYSFTKTVVNKVPREVTTAGIAFAPETNRTGLGAARRSTSTGESPAGEYRINIDSTNGPEMYSGPEAEPIINSINAA